MIDKVPTSILGILYTKKMVLLAHGQTALDSRYIISISHYSVSHCLCTMSIYTPVFRFPCSTYQGKWIVHAYINEAIIIKFLHLVHGFYVVFEATK